MATNSAKKKITRKSAGVKALRQAKSRTTLNNAKRISLQVEERLLKKALKNADKEVAKKALQSFQKKYAKAVKVGVLHPNKARRAVSHAATQFNKQFSK